MTHLIPIITDLSQLSVPLPKYLKNIYNQLSQYFNNNKILSQYQIAFRFNFSTTTALTKFTNNVFSASDRGHLTGAIFIDLTRAFDLVDHYLLLDKLHATGLSQHVLLCFNLYLHNRKEGVQIWLLSREVRLKVVL